LDLHGAARNSYLTARAVTSTLGHRRSGPEGVRILGYHRISLQRDALAITPEQFRRQMLSLLERDMSFVTLGEALTHLGEPATGRHVCVTFDDGYLDTVELALPILTELGIPATVFVVTDFLSATARFGWYAQPPPAMDWRDAKVLLDAGMEIGSHTRTHRWLPTLSAAEAWQEIQGSRLELEDRLSISIPWFCYPAGRFGSREPDLVRQAGYSAALTTRSGMNTTTTPRFELLRYMIDAGMNRLRFSALTEGFMDVEGPVTKRVRSLARRDLRRGR
jgi:peptidoglycan/xylan/chitin deacetylase (PgdA/CDA1 family)